MQPSQLHARRVGDILDTAFALYRTHFRSLGIISAVLLVPVMLLQIIFPAASQIIQSCQNFFLVTLLGGALTSASIETYWQRTPEPAAAYRHGAKKFLSLFGAALLQAVIILLPFILVGALIAFIAIAARLPSVGVVVLLSVAFVPLAIFFVTKYAVVVPIIMSEDIGANAALTRSWKLSTGVFWHVAITTTATSLMALLIGQLPSFVVTYLLTSVPTFGRFAWLPALQVVLSQLGLILTVPFQQLTATVLYYDLRIRSEAYDLEMAASEQQVVMAANLPQV